MSLVVRGGVDGGGGARWSAWLEELVARDYGRRHDRYLRWLGRPLVVLILAAVASSLCGFCLHPQGFVLAIGLGAIVLVGIGWPRVVVAGLRGSLAFDRPRGREGEPVMVRVDLINKLPCTAWGLAVRPGLRDGVDAGLAHADGWKMTVASWQFVPGCRGIYPAEPPRVATGFPFGLAMPARALAVKGSLTVWPRTFPIGPIPAAAGGRSTEGTAPRDRAGGTGDFLGVRPYRRGDSLRRIHWPQTARLGRMVICELQATATPRVQVVLDVHPAGHAGAGPDGSREWAIRIAASFAVEWIGAGAEVELVVAGRAIAPGGSVASRRAAVLDALARLGPDEGPDLAGLLDLPACRQFGAGFRLVIAPDRAVARLAARPQGGCTERFAVLRAAAFDPLGGDAAVAVESLPVRPWVVIDDPALVPQQVRRVGKELVS